MEIRLCTLVGQFWTPLRREWGMLHGLVDCSKESLQYLLDVDRTTNNIVVLVIGKLFDEFTSKFTSRILEITMVIVMRSGESHSPSLRMDETNSSKNQQHKFLTFVDITTGI